MNEYEQKIAARKARLEERAERLAADAKRTFSRSMTMAEAIPFGQPILVGHHSEKRDRAYRARIDSTARKSFALSQAAKDAAYKAASVGTGGVSSDDPDAVDKLREKLAGLEQSQERMKAANKAIRAHKSKPEQIAALVTVGVPERAATELVEPDFAGRIGFAAYQLSNNNAEIRRLRERITSLERAKARPSVEREFDGYTYNEDTGENRVMFGFDGKPSAAVRELLRNHAFKWSPSRNAWVRKLSPNARYAAERVNEALPALLRGDT